MHAIYKVKFLEITVNKGDIVFIPAYWWYTFKFDDSDSVILNFKYRTYMNIAAITPQLFISFLQKQNIKHDIIQKIIKN